MAHLDLGTYLADDGLTLNGIASEKHPKGASYTIPSPNAIEGLRLQRIMGAGMGGIPAKGDPAIADDMAAFCRDSNGDEIPFDVKLLGAAHAQMVADGVSSARMELICSLVVTHFGLGSHVSEAIVTAAGEAAARADQARATKPKPSRARKTTATPRKRAGSKSNPASGATPARTRNPASGRSSTSPTLPAAKAIKAVQKAG